MNDADDQNAGATQTLLPGNARLLAVNLVIGVLAITLAVLLFSYSSGWAGRSLAALLLACSIGICVFASLVLTRPRLAINTTELLVYLQRNPLVPYRVPLSVVEVFFIGQGAVSGNEPGQPKGYEGAVAANVIVRLAEAATEWHQRDVQLLLGVWDEGYITVRGLFSANIDQDVLKEMNRQLLQRKRALRASASASATGTGA